MQYASLAWGMDAPDKKRLSSRSEGLFG